MVPASSSICCSLMMNGGDSAMVSPVTRVDALLEAIEERLVAARARFARQGRELDSRHQSEIADVDHVGRALQAVHRLFEMRRERPGAIKQLLFVVER